jgi:hypothetical protein
MKRVALFVVLLALSTDSWTASPWAGVWVLRDSTKGFRLTMTLEEVGAGWKITYRIPGQDARAAAASVMTIETALDGKEVPNLVGGKPSGQTMEIRKVDGRHTSPSSSSRGSRRVSRSRKSRPMARSSRPRAISRSRVPMGWRESRSSIGTSSNRTGAPRLPVATLRLAAH